MVKKTKSNCKHYQKRLNKSGYKPYYDALAVQKEVDEVNNKNCWLKICKMITYSEWWEAKIAADNDRQIVPNDKIHSSPLFEKQ